MKTPGRTVSQTPSSRARTIAATRREGLVPAVIYGDKKDPFTITVTQRDLEKLLKPGFFSHLIDIEIDGEKHRVLPRDLQQHPVTDRPLHIDFLRVSATSELTVEVPVEFLNEEACPGLRRGGVLNVVRHEIEVYCLADNIPEKIEVDLAGLQIGDSLDISAVKLPDGVRPAIERDFTIATIAAPAGVLQAEVAEIVYADPAAVATRSVAGKNVEIDHSLLEADNRAFLLRAANLPNAEIEESLVGDVVPAAETVALLGGPEAVGIAVHNIGDLARAVQSGLPYEVIEGLRRAGIQGSEIETLVAPARTLARRRKDGRLTVEESTVVERLARTLVLANRVFGSRDSALRWLRTPKHALFGGACPLDYLHSDIGAHLIAEVLAQAEFGFVA